MKKIVKKSISLAVATILLSTTTLQAFDLKDDFLGNVTGVGSYNDDFTQSKYMYGGSIVYKFKNNSMSNAPLFAYEMPKIRAGCNGVSITGGFLQVLGLDGLADQLRNASTAVIYGIILGLIYSTPAIEQAISKIREIANWLQKFLQDSCSMGRTIGANLAEQSGYKEQAGKVSTFFDNMIQEGDDTVNELLGEVSDIPPEEMKTFVKNLLKTNNEERKQENAINYARGFEEYFKVMGIAGLILKNDLLAPSKEKVEITKNLVIGDNDVQQLYLLVHELFGDIGFDANTIDYIVRNKDAMSELITEGRTENEVALESEAIKLASQLKDSSSIPFAPKLEETKSVGPLTAKQKVNLLLYGNKTGPLSPPENLQVTPVMVVYGKLKTYNSTSVNELLSYAGPTPSTGDGATMTTINWNGLIKLSREHIDCAISYVSGDRASCEEFPIVYSKFTDYLNTIKDAHIKFSKTVSEEAANSTLEHYKDTLARYNAVKLSQALLATIEEELRGYQRRGASSSSSQEMLKEIEEMNMLLDEVLAKLSQEQDELKAIDEVFNDLKQELIMDKLQGS